MAPFLQNNSVRVLQKLKEHPVDLTQGAMTSERIRSSMRQALGLKLLYASERVNEEIMQALFDLAEESQALKLLQKMQQGEVLNRIEGVDSENRRVLHTAMRDQFEDPQESPPAREAADLARRELKKLEDFLERVEGRYTDLVQIGIGGSDLGPRALALALQAFYLPQRNVHFISNVDPDDAHQVLCRLNLEKTLVVVVSKSGSTLETLTNEALARSYFEKNGLASQNHFIAVTGRKSPMDDPSRYLASFYIWDFIGGRYSATSMVGGVSLGFALGYQGFLEILKGAHAMDRHAVEAKPSQNLPLISALLGIWNRNFLGYPTVAVIPYSQALLRFPAHLQQLDMESNGKQIDRQGQWCHYATGPVLWGEPGTNGQHSFYQLIHQGTTPVPLELIGFEKSQYGKDLEIQGTTSQEKLLSNLFAQSLALSVGKKDSNPNRSFLGNRPNRILLAERLDPFTLGSLLSFYEHKVALQGFIWNINSFDQEGVQLGKVLALQMLDLFQKKTSSFPLGKAYLDLLGGDDRDKEIF